MKTDACSNSGAENKLSFYREQARLGPSTRSRFRGSLHLRDHPRHGQSINKQENLLTLNKGRDFEVSPETAVVTPRPWWLHRVVRIIRWPCRFSIPGSAAEVAGLGHFGSIYWTLDAEHVPWSDGATRSYRRVSRATSGLLRTVEEFELNETQPQGLRRARRLWRVVLHQDYNEQTALEEGI